jgi:signal transduction histidine kinase
MPSPPPVLCVASDRDARLRLRHALEAAGFEPIEAGDGENAVCLARSRRPVAIVARTGAGDAVALSWVSRLRDGGAADRDAPKILVIGEHHPAADAALPASTDAATLGAFVRALIDPAHGDLASTLGSAESRVRMLANLSHELRNPLAAIRNAETMLRLASADPRVEHAREVIDRQATQLARLVDDLLDASDLGQGRVELRSALLPIGLVVEQAVEQTRSLFEARHQTLVVDLPEPVRVEGDVLRLAQALAHVLKNASRFTPDGGRIEIETAAVDGQASIVVRDNGVGIDPDHLPGLFAMFAQGSHEPDRTPGGLGLGLTVARAMMELHGGRLDAFSRGRGHGSEFVLSLPLAGPLVAPRSADDPAPVQDAPPFKVLVVDDNLDGAATLSLLLEYAGFEVRTAHDGYAALRAAAQFRPEAVVLDIGLPGMDGHEVASRLRAERAHEGLVLIALTGFADEPNHERSVEVGFDHHFVKPTDSRVLSDLLSEYAARRTPAPRTC